MARARQEPSEHPQVRLADGTLARILPSEYANGYELIVDGTPQSHVDLDDPTHLHFEYVARMGAVIDQLRMPRQPLTAVHLGAGALTIPRYVEATRPGSRQQVIELEPALTGLVREHLPLPKGAAIRIRIADGAGLAFARRQVATVRAVLPHVVVLAEVQTLKGRRFGNLVVAASPAPLPTEWLPRLMAAGPHPAKVAQGAELDEFVRAARPATDADATPSPKPAASVFER